MTESAPSKDNSAPEDDVKRRFREALERKQAKAKAGAAHEDLNSKVNHTHGPAAHKRTFRRKSG
ncbi:hypothetical protein DI005_03240 [Prauserella sp. PE36]|uniref:DUF5302 domain-containing protein n=1 Tax=Prauserella endophytica TaxID=1592324 RepID=A0ABY2S1N0_9PSEU|nr:MULTISPECIES: DUF5302 domain-containing protein [Prauserella]PXY25067.1 hypothetical protein BAY59_23840 [Prauserella coralliicola]RBM23519.1 hypothetical protein DI005_03240 [Prauserella sp. PE36]TKG69147.1 hypothetical protein FCN18_20330 [Prauserella endophytica]